MKNLVLILLAGLTLSLYSCGSEESDGEQTEENSHVDKEAFMKDFDELNKKINASESPDKELLKKAVTTYQDYASIFPDAEDAPDYLLKASDFALNTKQPEKSVKLLERIMTEYPDYNQMESVMFSHANHLDFELRDTSRAKEAYQKFLAEYPNSTDAPSARARLETISLSMEELGDLFMKNLEEGKADTTNAL